MDVEIYIVACDGNYTFKFVITFFSCLLSNINHSRTVFAVYILEKLHSCMFFDDEIKTSMFFPTLHDAMLHSLKKYPDNSKGNVQVYFMQ